MLLFSVFMVGFFAHKSYLWVLEFNHFYLKIKKPFEELVKRGVDIYKFDYRSNDIVCFRFDDGKYLYLHINKKYFSLFNGEEYLLSSSDKRIMNENSRFYCSMIEKYHDDIFVDIVILNKSVYSTNIFSDGKLEEINSLLDIDEGEKLSVDMILDKIINSGLDSLCETEKEFLKNNTKN